MSLRTFRQILDGKLSPYLSSAAYQFWRINVNAFEHSFYRSGYSGWALSLAHMLLKLHGVMDEMKAMCEAKTIEEQDRIWKTSLRRVFVESWLVRMIVNNPIFLWNALGVRDISERCISSRSSSLRQVPQNQKAALTNEGSVSQFLRETLDPIGSHALLSKGAYHYLLVRLCVHFLASTQVSLSAFSAVTRRSLVQTISRAVGLMFYTKTRTVCSTPSACTQTPSCSQYSSKWFTSSYLTASVVGCFPA